MTKPLPVWKRILFELAAACPNGLTRRDLEIAVGVGTAVTERIRFDIRGLNYHVETIRRRDGSVTRYFYALDYRDARIIRRTVEYKQWAKSQRGVTRVSS